MTNSENESYTGSFLNLLNNATVTLTSSAFSINPLNILPSKNSPDFTINTAYHFAMEITADAADFAALNLEIDLVELTISEHTSTWGVLYNEIEHTYNFYYPNTTFDNVKYQAFIVLKKIDVGGGIAMVGTVSMIVPK